MSASDSIAASDVVPTGYRDLPDAVLVADGTGQVIVLNPAGERILGRAAAEVLGRDFRDVLALTDHAGRNWWDCTTPYSGLATRTGQPENRLLLTPFGSGESREVLVTARYVRDRPVGPVIRLVVCLRRATARQIAERGNAELVSIVAHELRSPLTSVKGFTATLLTKWERFTDEQKRLMLETINSDADRVTRLITELLDISRMESGRLELRRQPVDIPQRARSAFARQIGAGYSPDRFVLEVLGELPEVWADPDKVDQILSNLVENAIRHGAGRVDVVVQPADGGGAGVEVVVSDQGSGIAPEVAPRLFTKFWRDGRRGGTGLGLYITRGLVEAHGGSIDVETAPGGGASFRVRLPSATPPFAR